MPNILLIISSPTYIDYIIWCKVNIHNLLIQPGLVLYFLMIYSKLIVSFWQRFVGCNFSLHLLKCMYSWMIGCYLIKVWRNLFINELIGQTKRNKSARPLEWITRPTINISNHCYLIYQEAFFLKKLGHMN